MGWSGLGKSVKSSDRYSSKGSKSKGGKSGKSVGTSVEEDKNDIVDWTGRGDNDVWGSPSPIDDSSDDNWTSGKSSKSGGSGKSGKLGDGITTIDGYILIWFPVPPFKTVPLFGPPFLTLI
mmetsp:Transcript_10391/g.22576  ORF Transcript_10391/g.22576 Transcript_10391/m.22576 type:complete len:121 (+) Transcript_10391:1952-2314(+)